jgi:UDP-N-acetyl-D-mannosaminuronic acid dehydrogenase
MTPPNNIEPSTKNNAAIAAYDICVLGLGYIGLPTASIFATKGKKVLGVDVVSRVVETINEGKIHIQEPDLDVLVRAAVQSGNLRASTKPEPADVFIIAVPTPFMATATNPRAPDLSFVEAAARSLAPVVRPGNLIILESTSPVGTTEKVRDWIGEELVRLSSQGEDLSSEFSVQGSQLTNQEQRTNNQLLSTLLFAHCPERILPGQMIKELVSNDRIAGGLTPAAAEAAKLLYQTFCSGEIFLTDARTAELAKLTENSFRDVNIAFANELSLICDRLSIDVWELIRLANRHPRVKILQPGPGVGGHCIAVDPWFIVDAAPAEARLIRTAREVNDSKPHHIMARVKAHATRFKNPVIACFGLAFKADVDDLRESPAMEITEHLAKELNASVLVVEPYVKTLPKTLNSLPNVKLVDAPTAVEQADILLLLVNHRAFGNVDRKKLSEKVVIDTRGFWR